LATELRNVTAIALNFSGALLEVSLSDGRVISVPLSWYPRLAHASQKERETWKLIGNGLGIHWPDLDEDVSVANLLDGKPSAESQESLSKWLAQRNKVN
jgi:hypothetical protein